MRRGARQQTLRAGFEVTGIGLHTGAQVRLRVVPGMPDAGLRVAAPGRPSRPAAVGRVSDTRFATTLGTGRNRVGTVEHWLAAMSAYGVDNATLRLVVGHELPAMDGSAAPIVARLAVAGLTEQARRRRYAVVRRAVEVRRPDGASVRLEPADEATLEGRYVFRAPVGQQRVRLRLDRSSFTADVAPARTFAFAEEVEALQRAGRGQGGSLATAVVFGAHGPQNPDGLRFADEPARHKLLDAVGDLALLGAPWVGRYVADRGGHALNVALVRRAVTTGAVEFATF